VRFVKPRYAPDLTAELLSVPLEIGALVPRAVRHAFICECSQIGCVEQIDVPLKVYSQVRETPSAYLVRAGHEDPTAEETIVGHRSYLIVVAASDGVTRANEAAPVCKWRDRTQKLKFSVGDLNDRPPPIPALQLHFAGVLSVKVADSREQPLPRRVVDPLKCGPNQLIIDEEANAVGRPLGGVGVPLRGIEVERNLADLSIRLTPISEWRYGDSPEATSRRG
jgi:hypothetical protein